MAEPTERPPTDEQIQAYLLGRLSDEDADPIEAMTITDDDFSWRLRAVEDDLVDAYVRGDLDVETRQQFERYYMASPRRRERVVFARGFNRAVDRTPARPDLRLVPMPAPVALTTRPRRSVVIWIGAAAAVVALFVIAGLLSRAAGPAPGAPSQTSRPVATPGPSPAQLRPGSPSGPATSAARVPPANTAVAAESAPAFVLLPETRSATAVAQVALAAGATQLVVHLQLETRDAPRYRVTMKDPGTDRVLWRGDWTTPVVRGDHAMVPVALPASLFKPQHYALELEALSGPRGADLVGSYVFEVVPK